jgi:hypothetical protein
MMNIRVFVICGSLMWLMGCSNGTEACLERYYEQCKKNSGNCGAVSPEQFCGEKQRKSVSSSPLENQKEMIVQFHDDIDEKLLRNVGAQIIRTHPSLHVAVVKELNKKQVQALLGSGKIKLIEENGVLRKQ